MLTADVCHARDLRTTEAHDGRAVDDDAVSLGEHVDQFILHTQPGSLHIGGYYLVKHGFVKIGRRGTHSIGAWRTYCPSASYVGRRISATVASSDLVDVLRLASQLGQRPAALRARPLCLGQRVPLLDGRQRRLRLRSV